MIFRTFYLTIASSHPFYSLLPFVYSPLPFDKQTYIMNMKIPKVFGVSLAPVIQRQLEIPMPYHPIPVNSVSKESIETGTCYEIRSGCLIHIT
jgi:hypothetical protein